MDVQLVITNSGLSQKYNHYVKIDSLDTDAEVTQCFDLDVLDFQTEL